MKISYSILTHNETDSLEKLLRFLVKWKQEEDEIVILDDFSDNQKTKELLDFYVSAHDIVFEQRNLLGDYGGQKNHLKSMCSGDYSFNLDADEVRYWGWNVNEEGWVNFPDWQGRLFKNRPNIKWEKPVHEMIAGFQTYAHLPTEKPFCIRHNKTIDKQEQQNQKYAGIMR